MSEVKTGGISRKEANQRDTLQQRGLGSLIVSTDYLGMSSVHY